MRSMFSILFAVMVTATLSLEAHAQRNAKKDADFVKAHPAAGDSLPDVSVFTPDGKPFQTAELRGSYAVITFGCLT